MTKRQAKAAEFVAWSETVGLLPHKVTVEERLTRGGSLYLRWWDSAAGNWRWKSLVRALDRAGLGATSLRDANGVVIPKVADWAIQQGWSQYRINAGLAPSETIDGAPSSAPLTIGGTWAVLTDRDTGLYPGTLKRGKVVYSGHALEVKRALGFAAVVWGADTSWAVIGRADLTKLMRRRLEDLLGRGLIGMRSTEITMARVIAAAAWLRDQLKIPATAALPKKSWRDDLKKDWLSLTGKRALPKPSRDRYTVEEKRALLVSTWKVDPRLGLLYSLAGEYRMGQARLSMRTDLVLDAIEYAPHGRFTIHGAGKKLGEVVYLTEGQRADVDRALAGYLAPLEARYVAGELDNYSLFPGGRMLGRKHGKARVTEHMSITEPVVRGWIANPFREAERRAELLQPDGSKKPIDHIPGRLTYGARRLNVDGMLGEHASDEALKASGGWSSGDVPRGIYADQENKIGRTEAMQIRARQRGEITPTETEGSND